MTGRVVLAAARHTRAAALVVVAMVLAGCAASASADTAGIEADVRAIPGVTDASSGILSTGAPGSFLLDTDLVVDAEGAARVANILRTTAAVVARHTENIGRYSFSVSTTSTTDPPLLDEVRLDEELGLPGRYSGDSLELTGDELASLAASSRAAGATD